MTLPLHETLLSGVPGVPFISTWRTATAGETITLPLSGGVGSHYEFLVDWGDGTTDVIRSMTDPKHVHAYATPGDHVVKITGTIIGWAFIGTGDKLKIRSIDQWGCLRFIQTQGNHFNGCTNLTIPAADKPVLNQSTAGMFRDCKALVACPAMANWDTSHVTNMQNMFMGDTAFNQAIGGWNTAKVTTMENMFSGASAFNQNIGTWNTGNVLRFTGMFQGCGKFDQPLTGWSTVNANDMSYMFMACSIFNQPLSHFVTSKVTTMTYMFHTCAKFDQPIGNWDTSKVTNMGDMFNGCSEFNQPLAGWSMGLVTSIGNMFRQAVKFNQQIGSWNTSSLTGMGSAFYQANAFNQDISQWNTSKVTNMSSVFYGATAFNCGQAAGVVHTLMQRTATAGWRVGKVAAANMSGMFHFANSFAGDISSWCVTSITAPPTDFATATHVNFTPALQPTWGACPIPD